MVGLLGWGPCGAHSVCEGCVRLHVQLVVDLEYLRLRVFAGCDLEKSASDLSSLQPFTMPALWSERVS